MNIDWKKERHAPDAGSLVCYLDDLLQSTVTEFEFGDNEPFRLIVYRHGDDVVGFLNLCPHHWVAMNKDKNDFKMWDRENHQMMCVHHTAVFKLTEGGACIDGPCKGSNLITVPLSVSQGQVWIAEE